MTKNDEIRDRLTDYSVLPHAAAALGMDVFMYMIESGDSDASSLILDFRNALQRWNFEDLVGNQINYAKRLASDPSDLIYEEMHKLFSLMDQIHGLEQIGLTVGQELIRELNDAAQRRFETQRSMAALVAEDRLEGWCATLWWYVDNLKQA